MWCDLSKCWILSPPLLLIMEHVLFVIREWGHWTFNHPPIKHVCVKPVNSVEKQPNMFWCKGWKHKYLKYIASTKHTYANVWAWNEHRRVFTSKSWFCKNTKIDLTCSKICENNLNHISLVAQLQNILFNNWHITFYIFFQYYAAYCFS